MTINASKIAQALIFETTTLAPSTLNPAEKNVFDTLYADTYVLDTITRDVQHVIDDCDENGNLED